jgi:hypothetical protein
MALFLPVAKSPISGLQNNRHNDLGLHILFDLVLIFCSIDGILVYNLGDHTFGDVVSTWTHVFRNLYHPILPAITPQVLTCSVLKDHACLVGRMLHTMPDYCMACFQLELHMATPSVLKINFIHNVLQDFENTVGTMHGMSNFLGMRPSVASTTGSCRFHLCSDSNCVAADVVNGRVLEYKMCDSEMGIISILDV